MTVTSFGKGEPSTILSGITDLTNNGMLPIAIVVFVASILVPTFKLIGLAWLLISVQRKRAIGARQRMLLFRFIEWIGRWSMLDIFVIAILVTLVNFGNFASVDANPGAIAFAAVVILTMLAAKTFDPRLIWDYTCPKDANE
jgi:paraquat-inducible protein A